MAGTTMDDSVVTSASAKDKEHDGIGIEVGRDAVISSDGRDKHEGGTRICCTLEEIRRRSIRCGSSLLSALEHEMCIHPSVYVRSIRGYKGHVETGCSNHGHAQNAGSL